MKNKIIVRFAPSPTGYMHVANLRTAIYNWLFAKQNHGTFLLRLEDTDLERSKEEYTNSIIKTLHTFNLDYTMSFRQSERQAIYLEIGKKLKEKGHAFFCQCAEEDTECNCMNSNLETGVLRFKVPENQHVEFTDMIYGKCEKNTKDIENFALLRSNGNVTYHFAVVVDDYASHITHVIRGCDHLTNTFKQVLIYEAMEWKIPKFAHLPMILGKDGKKLSKRNGDSSVESLLEFGYVMPALFNGIIRTGWGYKDEEIFSREDALKHFDLTKVGSNPAVFDIDKLNRLNSFYMKSNDYSLEIAEQVYNSFFEANKLKYSVNDIQKIVHKHYDDIISRGKTLSECAKLIEFIFHDYPFHIEDYDSEIIRQIKNLNNTLLFTEWMNHLKTLQNSKDISMTIRKILTNSSSGLPMSVIYEYKIHNKKIV
jgi:glutamyl-tRNA synthetase